MAARCTLGAYVLHRSRSEVESRHESTEGYQLRALHLSFFSCDCAGRSAARQTAGANNAANSVVCCVRGNICMSWVMGDTGLGVCLIILSGFPELPERCYGPTVGDNRRRQCPTREDAQCACVRPRCADA